MGFQFDTSGTVTYFDRTTHYTDSVLWSDLSPFVQGYVEAVFESLSEAHHQRTGLKPGDKVKVHTDEVGTVTRIIPGKLKSVQVRFADGGGQYFPFECTDAPLAFSDLAPETLARIMEDCARAQHPAPSTGRYTAEAGRRFWAERRAGQWKTKPPLTPYLGDDGKVYLRAALQDQKEGDA